MSRETEISELIAAAREHVLYLQELGVEGLAVEMAQSVSPPRLAAKNAAILPSLDKEGSDFVAAPRDISEVFTPAERRLPVADKVDLPAGKRLAALPSLKKREP